MMVQRNRERGYVFLFHPFAPTHPDDRNPMSFSATVIAWLLRTVQKHIGVDDCFTQEEIWWLIFRSLYRHYVFEDTGEFPEM